MSRPAVGLATAAAGPRLDIRERVILLQAEAAEIGSNAEDALAAAVTLLLTIAASNAALLSDLDNEPDFLRAACGASAWSVSGLNATRAGRQRTQSGAGAVELGKFGRE